MKKRRKPAPTLAKLKAKAWKLLSECIRREAADENGMVRCYTSGEVAHWKEMQAGHAIPGRTGATLLDEEIIRPQCARCNIWLKGNYPVFTTKLIREKAEEYQIPDALPQLALSHAMDWWEGKLRDSRLVHKWDRGSLEAKILEYRDRLAKLATGA